VEAAAKFDFLTEIRRVLGTDPAGTDFFAWAQAPSVEELARATTWLRSLPAGLGVAGLARRGRDQFGASPEP
jgi:hypothetical protein